MGKLKSRSFVAWLLATTLLIALVLRVGVAIRFPSIEYPDEIFESLEPAHHLAYGFGVVSWEWRMGVRSWVFPAFLAGVMRATDWMGPGSLGYLRAIIILLSALSLTTVWFGFAWNQRASGLEAGIIAAWACAICPALVYFAPKAFNEVVAGNVLLPGLYLGMYGERLTERKRLFLTGLFCGLAVSLRIQLAPAVGFALLYFCHSDVRRKAPALFAGFLLPVVAFGAVDAFTWSYPFQSFFRYFWATVLTGRSRIYGVQPWYWYGLELAKYAGPMLFLALVGVRRSRFLGWIGLIIVASHSVIAHKEVRFIYPVLPILMTLAALGLVEIASVLSTRQNLSLTSEGIVIVGLAFCLLTSATFTWSFPRWNQHAGGLIIMDRLSRDSSVCGIGLYGISWAWTGGYAHLHQNVPMIVVSSENQLQEQLPGFNVLVTGETLSDRTMGFESEGCRKGGCLYRRAGPCLASPAYNEVNEMLRRSGE
jgi:GPI mannosyltransferase 3